MDQTQVFQLNIVFYILEVVLSSSYIPLFGFRCNKCGSSWSEL